MRTFTVHFSTGQPAQPNQGATNSFGLRGAGQLVVDDTHLTFTGERHGFASGPARLARADVANVDHNAGNGAFLLRTRNSDDFVVFWTVSREDAEAIWALLPQEKTPEFLAEQQHHERYARTMSQLGRRALVTPTLIALNVAMFALMLVAGADFVRPDSALLIRFGSNFGPLTWSGEEWRLLSSAFLHAGIVHIALNMWALYQGGALVERLYGSARFALLYLLSALAGSVASTWWEPGRNSVGASGAIFGVYGALLVFFALRRADFPSALWKSVGTSALLMCGYSLAVGAAHPFIDNTAHIGGLLGGVLAGGLLVRPFDVASRRRPQPLRLIAAALVVLLPLAWMARPLVAAGEARASEWRYAEAVRAFARDESRLRMKLDQLLSQARANPGKGQELADRLNEEFLTPWREGARPILDAQPPNEEPEVARFHSMYRDYLLAVPTAVELRGQALRDGSPESAERAQAAEARVFELVRRMGAAARQGT